MQMQVQRIKRFTPMSSARN